MKPFHTITLPHKDILEGRLTMDVYAADLWEVKNKRGPDEYKDKDIFFKKTFITQGLNNLLNIVENRLKGKGGDPVIQIQTPFGGGKTHSLISMYHKSIEWNVKSVVIVGTALSSETTLWGLLEQQLTGKIDKLKGNVSPGKEAIRSVLSDNQPVLILMDELLEYATKAAGVKVGDSNLASQTIAFMQELTETTSNLLNVCMVVTLPSSLIEYYDENAERLYQQLQKVSGRVEKIYTPVEESEITKIIRRRLFSDVNEIEIKSIVDNFVNFAEKENILPSGMNLTEYREKFIASYPFMPEVVDVLYQRWGSFTTFQRTRGVLRLLSLLIYSVKDSQKSYISIADFDLSNQEIRQELLKHIGQEFNGVIASDITDNLSGAKKINNLLGDSYKWLNLGTRTATSIFLYSFSGGNVKGITLNEIKISSTTMENPPTVISEAIEHMKLKLFYLQSSNDKYFFSNQPNLNRILLNQMDNIKEYELIDLEKSLLKNYLKGNKFKIFLWEDISLNIPDNEDIKLIIMKSSNKEIIKEIIKTRGQSPRVFRNILIFLYPQDSGRVGFIDSMKHKIAYEYIEKDGSINLTGEQRIEIKKELKKVENMLHETMRRFYRMVAVPTKDDIKEIDLGIPTYGDTVSIDNEIYDKLRLDGEILEKIAPLVLKNKYLINKDFVSTDQIYQSSLKTSGELRFFSKSVLEHSIKEGVNTGLFGVGEIENNQPRCFYYKTSLCTVSLSGDEIIINENLCKENNKKDENISENNNHSIPIITNDTYNTINKSIPEIIDPLVNEKEIRNDLNINFELPKGKVSHLMGILNYLQSKFNNLNIILDVKNGSISKQEFDDKIVEAFRQMGIEVND